MHFLKGAVITGVLYCESGPSFSSADLENFKSTANSHYYLPGLHPAPPFNYRSNTSLAKIYFSGLKKCISKVNDITLEF